ncbi:MAG: DUF1905 domain-containing protein [Thermoleophilia bacterium]|nr:DUF1905 domain-containing protein [Thermoleophilia bacterium]
MFEFTFSETVIKYEGDGAAWHFITLPTDLAEEINRMASGLKGGWGSIKVRVTIGSTTWNTSIFPSKSQKSYVLPVKAAVRKAETIEHGDEVEVTLAL